MRITSAAAIMFACVMLFTIHFVQISKSVSQHEKWIENHRYHAVLHHQTLQVAPENPCEKCGGSIFNGCHDGPPDNYVHYFCAHCGYLKFVVPYSKVMSKPDHDELWKLKKFY